MVWSLLGDFLSVFGGVYLVGDTLALSFGSVFSFKAGTGEGLRTNDGLRLLPLRSVSIIKNY